MGRRQKFLDDAVKVLHLHFFAKPACSFAIMMTPDSCGWTGARGTRPSRQQNPSQFTSVHFTLCVNFCAGIQATSYSGDVRKEIDAQGAVQKAVSTYGHLNMLVCIRMYAHTV